MTNEPPPGFTVPPPALIDTLDARRQLITERIQGLLYQRQLIDQLLPYLRAEGEGLTNEINRLRFHATSEPSK